MTRSRQWLYGWLLVLPAAALLALFTHYPVVATLWGSFRSTPKGARPAVWVGVDNYRQLDRRSDLLAVVRQQPVVRARHDTGVDRDRAR